MTSTATVSSPEVSPRLATTEVIFRKLLVAIDFTAQTQQVLKTAIDVARCFDVEMLLVHAAWPVIYGTGAEPVPIDTYAIDLEAAQAKMAELVASEPALQQIKHREIVQYASALDLVQQIVHDETVDLVIAGSHGAHGLERLVLASVAEAMLRHLHCPVLIVGPRATSFICPFRSVLLASTLKLAGLRAAQYASGLAEKFHGKLTALHVIEETPSTRGIEAGLLEHRAKTELTRLLPPDLNLYSKAEVRTAYGKPAQEITFIAREECASVIVCGVAENAALADHTLGSTLAQVIREAHCPVLCVRRHSA
jgi:nucleotide-binding universal stress UspA family protein